ncbi:hypothetical protein [Solirubrobacter soli]|uniref:hypothetical protein n=1 Tax=Solirubrobacter soli TaxID=363832 RepID=UPI0012F9196C|nr:hypothetical protein [Solirubrobacter soli]
MSSFARAAKDLWWTLAPLLIPILGVLAIAAFALPPVTAIFVLALFAGLGALLLWHLRRQLVGAVKVLVDTKRGRTVLAAVATFLVASLVIVVLAGANEFADAYEFWSWLLVWLGFALWALALILRLPSFARGTWRTLFVVVFALAFARYYLWLFVGGSTGLRLFDHIAWIGLLAGLLIRVALTDHEPLPEEWHPGHFGVVAAVLSAVFLMVAGVAGMASDPPVKRDDARYDADRTPAARPVVPQDPEALAKAFAPVLELTDGERWKPMRVDAYLAKADLYDPRGRVIKPPPLTPSDLPRDCPGGKQLCYWLTIHCSLDESSDQACEDDPQPDRKRGFAYARVVDKAAVSKDPATSDRLFPPTGPYKDELSAIVQYWLFYYYDDWQARTVFGQMRQGHEADWEAVTIGFSDTEPLFLALSAHCAGTWLPWKDVRIAEAATGAHPLVAVAQGSQANYHDNSVDIPSNWLRCKGLGSKTLDLANLAYKIRDRTGDSTTLPLDVEVFDKADPEMDFAGWWGLHNVTWFETAFHRRYNMTKETQGPESPARKADWLDPVSLIFCDPRWQYVGEAPRPRYSCRR